ncbi:MAG: hypothetical protein WCY60_03425 [Trueperaceae bacterium]|jgi:hypothetical protein
MKKVLAVVMSLALVAAASARVAVSIDDAGVNYNDLPEVAYMSLDWDGNALAVRIQETASDDSLPAIAFLVPDLERTDFFGATIGAELSDVPEFTVLEQGSRVVGFEVVHQEVSMNDLVASYHEALADLGFSVQTETTANGNFGTINASNAAGAVQVLLHNWGADVTARVVTL